MADNKRWFKVWTSILADPDFFDLSLSQRGIWVTLGALVAKHGKNGTAIIKKDYLERVLGILPVDLGDLNGVGLTVSDDNGTVTVRFQNWRKYQVDSTGYERLKRHREKQNDNGLKKKSKKKIKNKKKEEEKKVYGELENVNLTDEELAKLKAKFPSSWNEKITNLSLYLESKGDKYKSHYATILSWARKNEKDQPQDSQHHEGHGDFSGLFDKEGS